MGIFAPAALGGVVITEAQRAAVFALPPVRPAAPRGDPSRSGAGWRHPARHPVLPPA
ncbi:hypothetical protein NKH77_23490 [Streptomyces sp. M19]